ncbi:MAG: heme ABC transporter ATP-binding protein [Pseudomonadales bacterium]
MSISVTDLSFQLGESVLLSEVSFDLDQGSINVVVGPNGSGKTSLVKVLCGEYVPTAGTVEIDERDVHKLTPENRARLISVLPQEAALDFPFRVEEVVQMGRIPHSTSERVNRAILSSVLAEMKLDELRSRNYQTLSGGEKQRVQIARVLNQIWDVLDGAWLILDEPTAAMDLAHQLLFFKTLNQLKQQGATILLVVHDLNIAMRYADRIILMSSARLLATGKPIDVLNSTLVREAFNVEIQMFATDEQSRPFIIPKV